MEGLLKSDFRKAQELLKEASYDGTPIVLLQSTDLQALTNLAPVAKALMEKAGFNVDMQSMDWQTLVARRAKKDPPNAGGWHAFLTGWTAADISNPIFIGFFNSACEKALFGWPCDPDRPLLPRLARMNSRRPFIQSPGRHARAMRAAAASAAGEPASFVLFRHTCPVRRAVTGKRSYDAWTEAPAWSENMTKKDGCFLRIVSPQGRLAARQHREHA
jgi:hypothetical protein